MNPHLMLIALDPPRKNPPRRWRCNDCGDTGLYDDVHDRACTAPPPPPCEWCGQTPLCARDCMGMAVLLGATPGLNVIKAQKPQQCDDCGETAELRPYGPGGSVVCYPCGMKDPEETRRQLERAWGEDS
jgi:hypothetical protein